MTLRFLALVSLGLVSGSCDCADSSHPGPDDAGTDGGEDDGGDAGRIPGRAVRIPAVVDAPVGAIVKVGVTIVAGAEPWATTLTAEAPRFDYIEGQPAHITSLGIDSVALEAGHQKEYSLRFQTLLTWDHTITLRVHGEAYEVPVHPTLVSPLIGVEGFGCDGPHEVLYGPDCGPCGLVTTSAVCAQSQPLGTCHPSGFQIPDGADENIARANCDVGANMAIQQTRAVPSSFWNMATDPTTLDLTELTWVSGVMESQLRTRPVPSPGYQAWWMYTCSDCANTDGSFGPYDPANPIVFGGLEEMGRAVGSVRGVAAVELADASLTFPILCPCVSQGVACAAATGPNQAACALPDAMYTEELGAAYGPLVAAIATRVATGVHAASTEAKVVSAPVDVPARGLTPLTRVALENGLGDAVDALGIVVAPMPAPTWLDPMPNCALAEPGCETAPPFEDWTALLPPEGGGDPVPTPVSAHETWRQLDRDLDLNEVRIDLRLGGWEDFPLWVTSLRAGFHGSSPREVVAGLRAGAILTTAHAEGMSFAFPATNVEGYEVLTRALTGAHPIGRPEVPEGYDDLVMRFFSRAGQDIIVAWNNDDSARVAFIAAEEQEYRQVTLTTVHASAEQVEISTETLPTPDTQLDVQSLTDVVILMVDTDDNLEFRWLESLQL